MAAVLAVMAAGLIGCGREKITGPAPETGDVALKVLYLVDPRLPALTDGELHATLDRSSEMLTAALGRRVTVSGVQRADLQQVFDRWLAPFGRTKFSARLNPARSLSEDEVRTAYARIMELLRSEKIRPLLPRVSLDPNVLEISVILETLVHHLDDRLEKLRASSALTRDRHGNPILLDRQSIFSWYTILGSFPEDTKPADVILTNDLLFFDSLMSMPPEGFVLGGVSPAYTRVYPGISIVSTLPFLSDDPIMADLCGPATVEQKRDLIALAIAKEVGGKLILMRQDEYTHASCLNTVMAPPFVGMLSATPLSPCGKQHHPVDRRRLRADYLASFVQFSRLTGDEQKAKRALDQLKELVPDHPLFFQIPAPPPTGTRSAGSKS